ncbi:MAG: VanZ family protein [Caldilineaceae bacterium]
MFNAYWMPIGAAIFFFPAAALLLLLPICVIHYRRFGNIYRLRALAFYAFLLYGMCAFFLTLLPLPVITPDFCELRAAATQPRLVPFESVRDIERFAADRGLGMSPTALLHNSAFYQVVFNFLLLAPLGIFVRYLYGVRLGVMAALAVATALFFEVTQLTAVYGLYPCPYRLFDVDDLWLNASGALLGYLIMPLLVFLPDWRNTIHATPTKLWIRRRLAAFVIDMAAAQLITVVITLPLGGAGWAYDVAHWTVIALWFVAVPVMLDGYTLGKRLLHIRLAADDESAPQLVQLIVRYAVLLAGPVLLSLLINWLMQPGADGWVEGPLPLIGLLLLAAEAVVLPGLVLLRSDHRGLHDLLAGTTHVAP